MFRQMLLAGSVALSVFAWAPSARAQSYGLSMNPSNSNSSGSLTADPYPAYLWNYGSWRSYERWEKEAIQSRWKLEAARNEVEILKAKIALKDLGRANREANAMARVSVVKIGFPVKASRPAGAPTVLRDNGQPNWPTVLLYRGFDAERQQVDQFMALNAPDHETRQMVVDLLTKMQLKLGDYRNADKVVIQLEDFFKGKRFLKDLQEEVRDMQEASRETSQSKLAAR